MQLNKTLSININPTLRRLIAKWSRIVLGALLILLGIPGLILPLIPGIPLILLGIFIVRKDIPLANNLTEAIHRLRRKFPTRFRS